MSFDLKLSNGDLKISKGQLEIVEDNDKLIQDVLKLLTSDIGSCPLHPDFAGGLDDSIIGENLDLKFTTDMIADRVRSAIEKLKFMQDQQSKTQYVSPAEKIVAVKDVYVNHDKNDPRKINIRVSIYTAKLTKPVNITFSISL